MTRARLLVPLLLASCVTWAAPAFAEEPPPLSVGSEGVPVPKKTKDVKPRYPAEAVARGIRGIVILDLVIDAEGAVESVNVVRSVPGLDEAALVAAYQWRYAPVKVDGRPARVRMTVPITFSLALPKLARDAGVPELRQGVMPVFPEGAEGGGMAAVAVMLETDGSIAVKGPLEGSQEPWTGALLAALETWRFSPVPDETVVSFRIEAEFTAGKRAEDAVSLRATGLKVADARDVHEPAPAPPASPAPAPPEAAPPQPAAPAAAPPAAPVAAEPAPAGAPMGTPVANVPPAADEPGSPVAAPPLEVVSAAPPPPPPENGISLVRDVTLEPGVPELSRGRRPVPPPFARIERVTGSVEVAFSVSAAGVTTVQTVAGPELLKKAAEDAVASWTFRRTRADRAYLVADFDYADEGATATVRPQPAAETPGPAASPMPLAPPREP